MNQSIYAQLAASDASIGRRERHAPSPGPSASSELPLHEHPERNQAATALSPKELATWRWANVENLDMFLQEVYGYFLDKGFYCIVLRRALNMATVLFVVAFSTYLWSCIDYGLLWKAKTLADIRKDRCIARTSLFHRFALWVFGALWFLKCFQYVSDIKRLWEIHDFYLYLLGINEDEIQTISWQQVVERLVHLKSTNMVHHQADRRGDLDAHGIINRIMRKENYMIALYSNKVCDLTIDLPFVKGYEFLTKTLEWSINVCVVDYVFNENGHLRPIFLNESKRDLLAAGLRRRFQIAAMLNLVFAPFAVFYMSLYYFFRYFNDYRSNPTSLGTRQYTPLAEWRFRELNELFHLFKRRLSMSDQPAMRYISQFPRERTEILLRFVVFICSSFAAVIAMASIYDPELLKLEITPDHPLSFYLLSLGLLIAVARGMSAPEADIYQPEAAMRQVVVFTHYMPDDWEGKLHTEKVKTEFCQLYDLKPKIILRDLFSVFINPIILYSKLAPRSERIIDFFRDFSVKVDSLGGYVCSFAVFNTDRADKVKQRSDALDIYYATADGKMLKSYLNFMDVYGPNRNQGYLTTTNGSAPQAEVNDPMSASTAVMDQFAQLRALSPVQEESGADTDSEEANTTAMMTAPSYRTASDLNLNSSDNDDDDDDGLRGNGVIGLLNNLYKADGRPQRV